MVGAVVVFDPGLLTQNLDLFTSPSLQDVVYALVIATVAFAGIEAAADLAPDIDWRPHDAAAHAGCRCGDRCRLIYAAVRRRADGRSGRGR